MQSAVDSAVVTRDAALAACGYEMMQSKGTSGKAAERRQSITDAGLLGKEIESRNRSGSSAIGAFKSHFWGLVVGYLVDGSHITNTVCGNAGVHVTVLSLLQDRVINLVVGGLTSLLLVVTLISAFVFPQLPPKPVNIFFAFCISLCCISAGILIYWYRQGDLEPKFRNLIYYILFSIVMLCICANLYFHEVGK
nr:PREDICTED: transmembrane protein 243 [Balearica regulorum gibbericeps]